MKLEDDLCLCFHVSKRKVINFIRNEKPVAASQLSNCFGAGSGCGWCRKYLTTLFEQISAQQDHSDEGGAMSTDLGCGEESAEAYAEMRQDYLRKGRGKPRPGAS
ncbi:MAG: (2Fe-2S)-binding protein [Pirellulales bacterium]|nr:(2Fe-2S)-binding protein [Pirellulales bacterium]